MASGDPVIDGKTTDLVNCVNVKASPYNALGNGSNDTTAFNSAIAVANASKATLFIPAGIYDITPGSMTIVETNIDGPYATLRAYTAADSPLLRVENYAAIENHQFIRLRALAGYGSNGSDQYNPATKHGYGLYFGTDHVRGGRFDIQYINGFIGGIFLDSASVNKHIASMKFRIGYIIGNTYGILLRSGNADSATPEASRFEVEYMRQNTVNIWLDGSAGLYIPSNSFDITCMELHQQAGDIGFYLSGSNVYQNTFKVNGSFVTGTGYAIVADGAHDNRFELSYLPFNKINMTAGNVLDQRTTEVGYPGPVAGRARSQVMDSAAPTVAYWRAGDICWNTNPASGVLLWVARANGVGAAANWGTVNVN